MFAHPWNCSRSSNGTPSSSQIIVIGSGSATACTKSTGCSIFSIASSRPSTTSWARPRSACMRRAVNVALTSRRMRVCSGASIPRIESSMGKNSDMRPTSVPMVAARLKRGSASIERTSS